MANGDNANQESSFGQSYVGYAGILVIAAYLVVLALAEFYVLVKIWPPDPLPSVSITSNVSPQTNAGGPKGPAEAGAKESTTIEHPPIKWQLTFIWCDDQKDCWISLNTSLFLIAILSGALGSLLHSLRSFYWYAGNRKLKWSWALMYMLLPFSGSVLAIIFYIIIRAGFLPSSSSGSIPNTPYGFAAAGALVGLFSEEAMLKLKQVAETVFTRTPPGRDHAAPAPKISSVTPNTGPIAGGTAVTISGTDFAAGAKVTFGGIGASSINSITATSIGATTPPHQAGPVDIEVTNADSQKGTQTGAYKYV